MNKKRFFLIAAMLMVFTLQPVMAQECVGNAEAVRGDSASSGWVEWVVNKYDQHMNYWTVGALMAVESSFIPFPSEVVIPPAVYVALDENSQSGMNWWLVVLFGTLGALVGAFINYFLSRWLGRPIIYAFVDSKVGHMLQLSGEKMERAEKYFNDHGVASTLIGRLIPVVRQLISIPAGLSKMNIGTFALYTTLGALIWNCVLALLGYLAHLAGDLSVVKKYSSEISHVIIGLVILIALFFIVRYFIKKNRKK